jgi:hypothetical protein
LQFFKRAEKRAGLRAGQALGKLHDGGMHPQHQKPVPPRIQPPASPQYVYVVDERKKEPWRTAERAGVGLNLMLLLVAGFFALSGSAAFLGQAKAAAAGGIVAGGLLVLLDLVYWIGVLVVFIMLLVHGAPVRAFVMLLVSGVCFLLSIGLVVGGFAGFSGGAQKEADAAAVVREAAEMDKAIKSGLIRDELLVEVAKAAKLAKPAARQEARQRLMQQSWHGMVEADGNAVREAIETQLGPTPRPLVGD